MYHNSKQISLTVGESGPEEGVEVLFQIDLHGSNGVDQ